MPRLKSILSFLILAILISLLVNRVAFAQQPRLAQSPPTLESQTKKITPLATPSVTINPQPQQPSNPVSKPFWTPWSRCSAPGGLSCTSAATAVVIIIALLLTGFWLKRSIGKKHKNSNQ